MQRSFWEHAGTTRLTRRMQLRHDRDAHLRLIEGRVAGAGGRRYAGRLPPRAREIRRRSTEQGRPRDPYPHARALLVGAHAYRIRVPSELSPEERDRWRKLAEHDGDNRLEYAERAGALDGRIVQHLSGGPELLDAYLSGPNDHFTRHEHALITAALDARRFGHTPPLPAALLAEAADGALAPHHRAAREGWASPTLDALTGGERPDGTRTDIRCTLTPLRARRGAAGSLPLYEPTDTSASTSQASAPTRLVRRRYGKPSAATQQTARHGSRRAPEIRL